MAGTKLGGQKAAATTLKRHGKNFYSRIGQIGGQNGTTGGFFYMMSEPCDCGAIVPHENRAGCAGAVGGKISKRKSVPAK